MTREEMMDNLGNNLEKERIALHFSQSQMAEALDMSLSSYKELLAEKPIALISTRSI